MYISENEKQNIKTIEFIDFAGKCWSTRRPYSVIIIRYKQWWKIKHKLKYQAYDNESHYYPSKEYESTKELLKKQFNF